MAPHAEFEEKEYEAPLYRELLGGGRSIWTPGQVFEHHFGVDAALEVKLYSFWRILGYKNPLPGIIPDDVAWEFIWSCIPKRNLPNFELNAFIQSKRPIVRKRRSAELRGTPITTPFYRFDLTPHQQASLQAVAQQLGDRAIVVYAAAAFSTFEDLFALTQGDAVVENSTFIPARQLAGHKSWNYDRPGNVGCAASEPEMIEGVPLDQMIADLLVAAEPSGGPNADRATRSLEYLVTSIYSALRNLEEPGARTRLFLRLVDQLPDLESPTLTDRGIRCFQQLRLFSATHGLTWYVLG